MEVLKNYLANRGTPDERFYLEGVMRELYKDYQYYYFYFDEEVQTPLEAVESVLENQLNGKVGLEDTDWYVWCQEEDCICLWDFTTSCGTHRSWLAETVELSNKVHKVGLRRRDRKYKEDK